MHTLFIPIAHTLFFISNRPFDGDPKQKAKVEGSKRAYGMNLFAGDDSDNATARSEGAVEADEAFERMRRASSGLDASRTALLEELRSEDMEKSGSVAFAVGAKSPNHENYIAPAWSQVTIDDALTMRSLYKYVVGTSTAKQCLITARKNASTMISDRNREQRMEQPAIEMLAALRARLNTLHAEQRRVAIQLCGLPQGSTLSSGEARGGALKTAQAEIL